MVLLASKDELVQKGIEATIERTPDDIRNEQGFDFTIGSPLRAFMEGLGIITSLSQDTTEEEVKKQARETLFILSGVTIIPASKASGVLEITSTQSLTIDAGESVFSTATGTKVAETTEEVSFVNVEVKDVAILSDIAGADVSFPAGTLFLTIPNQSGGNLLLIDNGTDEETNYERTQRVADALKAKAHGTAPALITTAEAVNIKDGSGVVIESVVNALMSFPWKHEDPETIDPDRLGEIVMSIQSSIGVPSQDLLDEIQLQLTGNDELDGKQGAGQNIVLNAVDTEDIAFVVPYVKLISGVHATIEANIQSKITTYVESLTQGQAVNPTDWQAAISGTNKPVGVDYYDEENMVPSTIQEIDEFKIWNITSITVTDVTP